MSIASNASLAIADHVFVSQTIQHIATLVESDYDLVHFRQSCRSVSNAIEGDRSSFWRRRFLSKFEKPRNSEAKKWNNVQYKLQYQYRRSTLRGGALFKHGKTEPERKCMRVLRDLITGKDNTCLPVGIGR